MRVTRIVASGDTRFQFLLVFADGFGCSDPVTARLHLLILLDTPPLRTAVPSDEQLHVAMGSRVLHASCTHHSRRSNTPRFPLASVDSLFLSSWSRPDCVYGRESVFLLQHRFASW